ncbi:MAG TPA: nitrile hydratase subunit alpha [Solirubrobacterales bacterium]|nr:nitrile hydratase subunit alpha [Solirubrobacterales bacterium]
MSRLPSLRSLRRSLYEGQMPRTGCLLADEVELRVVDSTADMRYLVLPLRPAGSEGASESDLARLVTRDSMIGVSQPRPPAAD